MKSFKANSLSIISAIGLCVSLPAVGAVDVGQGYISNATPKPWVVKSNGTSYHKFNHFGMLSVVGRLKYDTHATGRIKSWWAKPSLTNGYGIASVVPGMNAHKISKTYSVGSRPKKINKILPFTIPATKVGPRAIVMCNWLANSLRKKGFSNQKIFSKNREVSFIAKVKSSVNAYGAGSGNPMLQADIKGYKIKVRCAKWTGANFPTAGNFATKLKIYNAIMAHKIIKTPNGACKVKLRAVIRANKPNATIKFRYKSQSGKHSQIFTMKTNQNKRLIVTHTWSIQGTGSGPFDGSVIHLSGVSPVFKSNNVSAFAECKKSSPSGVSL